MKPGRSRTPRGQSDEFWSPRDIIAELERLNGARYVVDLAANTANTVAPNWYLGKEGLYCADEAGGPPHALLREGAGSLSFDWVDVINRVANGPAWLNSPFSKPNLPAFTAKAWEAAPLLAHPLDLLIPVSTRAGSLKRNGEEGWWRGVWQGDVVGGHAIHRGPLRGQVLRFDCTGYRKEIIFLGYALRFLENGQPADGALGSHAVVRLQSKTPGQQAWRW